MRKLVVSVHSTANNIVTGPPSGVVTGSDPVQSLEWGEYEPAPPIADAEVEERIGELKKRDGGDIITFGSPILVQSLTNAGLVDEYRIIVHPVIVNEGRRLFENLNGRTDLRLVGVDTFARGAMVVTYAPTSS